MTARYAKSALAAAAITIVTATAGSAATLVCPGPVSGSDTIDRYLELTSSVAMACLDSGTEPTGDGTFQTDNPSWTQIAKADDTPALFGTYVSVTTGSATGGNSGAFDFTAQSDGYGAYAILFKFGKPSESESWFAVQVAAEDFAMSWRAIDDSGTTMTQHALSHMSLYGTDPTVVPLPASGLLLLGGLGGLAALRRRRKSA